MGLAVKSRGQASLSPGRTKSSEKVMVEEKKNAFLITSPGFGSSLVINLVAMGTLAALCVYVQPLYEMGEALHGFVTEQMMHGAHRMAWWSLLGLLSSSCCALQIVLNMFSFGCAGFNTALGPWRPTFVALTITVQTISWCVAAGRPYQWAPTAGMTALSLTLTLLPEALALYTARRERLAASAVADGAVGGHKRIALQLESLGCSACVAKVSSVLDSTPAVQSHHVCLEDGVATVLAASTCTTEEIVHAVEAAGFPAKVMSTTETNSANSIAATETLDQAAKTSGVESPVWTQRNNFAIVAGLLSSSCCLLQLLLNGLAMLNVLHVGCAGFNKVLGPWRTEMRTGTIGWLGLMWALAYRHRWPKKPLLGSTVLAVSLAWLPEILLLYGTQLPASRLLDAFSRGLGSGGFSMFGIEGIAPATEGAEQLLLNIDGMGCEACQLHVRTVIEMSAGVLSSSVDWEAGTADLWVNPDWGFNLTRVSAHLAEDGYTTTGSKSMSPLSGV